MRPEPDRDTDQIIRNSARLRKQNQPASAGFSANRTEPMWLCQLHGLEKKREDDIDMPVTQLHDDESIDDRASLPGCRMYRCDVRDLGPSPTRPPPCSRWI